MKQTININWNDLKSIKDAERVKTRLENKGFNLIKTETTGLDKTSMTYEVEQWNKQNETKKQ